jgi:hypothetical protein
VDLIDKALDLTQQCGSLAALKRLVARLADKSTGCHSVRKYASACRTRRALIQWQPAPS